MCFFKGSLRSKKSIFVFTFLSGDRVWIGASKTLCPDLDPH